MSTDLQGKVTVVTGASPGSAPRWPGRSTSRVCGSGLPRGASPISASGDAVASPLRNLAGVAEAAGASLADAVRVGVFMREMQNFAAVNEVCKEFFPEPLPARTTVQSDLRGFEIEVDAVLARER